MLNSAVMWCETRIWHLALYCYVCWLYDQMRRAGFYSLLWVQFTIQYYCVDNTGCMSHKVKQRNTQDVVPILSVTWDIYYQCVRFLNFRLLFDVIENQGKCVLFERSLPYLGHKLNIRCLCYRNVKHWRGKHSVVWPDPNQCRSVIACSISILCDKGLVWFV